MVLNAGSPALSASLQKWAAPGSPTRALLLTKTSSTSGASEEAQAMQLRGDVVI